MDLDEIMIKDKIKVYVRKTSDTEFSGEAYVDDLPEYLRAALGLPDDLGGELEITGELEVEIDDPSDQIAYPILKSLRLHYRDKFLDIDADSPGIDSEDIERQLDSVMNWADFWADYQGSRIDRAMDYFEDR